MTYNVATRRLPGELGLWLFIISDLFIFGLYFVAYAYDFNHNQALFVAGQSTLLRSIGLINTLLLLTGSWSVALGVNAMGVHARRASLCFAGGALSGAMFLCLKWVDYAHLIGAAHTLIENRFYQWYFILTAFHALHVLIGVLLLAALADRVRKGPPSATRRLGEMIGCYWHMVDLIWIAIFALVYLL